MAENIDDELEFTLHLSFVRAREARHMYITVEHVLYGIVSDNPCRLLLESMEVDVWALKKSLDVFLAEKSTIVPGLAPVDSQPTLALQRVLQRALLKRLSASSTSDRINGCDLLVSIIAEPGIFSAKLLARAGVTIERLDFARQRFQSFLREREAIIEGHVQQIATICLLTVVLGYKKGHRVATAEHLLLALIGYEESRNLLLDLVSNLSTLENQVEEYISINSQLQDDESERLETTPGADVRSIVERTNARIVQSGTISRSEVIGSLLLEILNQPDSFAAARLKDQIALRRIEADYETTIDLHKEAYELYKADRVEQAINVWLSIVDICSKYENEHFAERLVMASRAAGGAFLELGRPDDAVRCFLLSNDTLPESAALQTDPSTADDPYIWFYIALGLDSVGQIRRSREYLAKAATKLEGFAKAHSAPDSLVPLLAAAKSAALRYRAHPSEEAATEMIERLKVVQRTAATAACHGDDEMYAESVRLTAGVAYFLSHVGRTSESVLYFDSATEGALQLAARDSSAFTPLLAAIILYHGQLLLYIGHGDDGARMIERAEKLLLGSTRELDPYLAQTLVDAKISVAFFLKNSGQLNRAFDELLLALDFSLELLSKRQWHPTKRICYAIVNLWLLSLELNESNWAVLPSTWRRSNRLLRRYIKILELVWDHGTNQLMALAAVGLVLNSSFKTFSSISPGDRRRSLLGGLISKHPRGSLVANLHLLIDTATRNLTVLLTEANPEWLMGNAQGVLDVINIIQRVSEAGGATMCAKWFLATQALRSQRIISCNKFDINATDYLDLLQQQDIAARDAFGWNFGAASYRSDCDEADAPLQRIQPERSEHSRAYEDILKRYENIKHKVSVAAKGLRADWALSDRIVPALDQIEQNIRSSEVLILLCSAPESERVERSGPTDIWMIAIYRPELIEASAAANRCVICTHHLYISFADFDYERGEFGVPFDSGRIAQIREGPSFSHEERSEPAPRGPGRSPPLVEIAAEIQRRLNEIPSIASRRLSLVSSGQTRLLPWNWILHLASSEGQCAEVFPSVGAWLKARINDGAQTELASEFRVAMLGDDCRDATGDGLRPILWVRAEAALSIMLWNSEASRPLAVQMSRTKPVWPPVGFDPDIVASSLFCMGHGYASAGDPSRAGLYLSQRESSKGAAFSAHDLKGIEGARQLFMNCCVLARTKDVLGEPLGMLADAFLYDFESSIGSLVPVRDFDAMLISLAFQWVLKSRLPGGKISTSIWSKSFRDIQVDLAKGIWPDGFGAWLEVGLVAVLTRPDVVPSVSTKQPLDELESEASEVRREWDAILNAQMVALGMNGKLSWWSGDWFDDIQEFSCRLSRSVPPSVRELVKWYTILG